MIPHPGHLVHRPRYDRPRKKETRDLLFRSIGRKASLLTLPGDGALCSQSLLAHGVIDRDTPQHWIEKKEALAARLPALANRLGFTAVQVTTGLFEECNKPPTVDLVNADLESSFTEGVGLAFERISEQSFAQHATVVVWLAEWARNPATSDFHRWAADQAARPGLLHDLADDVSGLLARNDPTVVMPIALLACALHRFSFRFVVSRCYADSKTTMLAFRIDDLCRLRGPSSLPSFSSLVNEFRGQHNRGPAAHSHEARMLGVLRTHFARADQAIVFQAGQWRVVNRAGRCLVHAESIECLFESVQPFMAGHAA